MTKLLTLLVVSVLLCAGCTDPYGSCAKAGADIASGISQGFNTIVQLQQQGLITQAEEADVAGYLKFANDGDKAFLSCVTAAHTNGNKVGTYTACANTFNLALNTPAELALLHVNNATASTTISTIVNGLTAASKAITAGLGGA